MGAGLARARDRVGRVRGAVASSAAAKLARDLALAAAGGPVEQVGVAGAPAGGSAPRRTARAWG